MPTTKNLPPVPSVDDIKQRLEEIFPEGTTNRNYCIRELAAKTIFVMLYVGAIAGFGRWLRPDQVTRMTDQQATKINEKDRERWTEISLKATRGAIRGRWYAQNTREPIRDETIRNCFLPAGAVEEKEGLPTTSSKPRYALAYDFAQLFDPGLVGQTRNQRIKKWREAHLTPSALARVQLVRQAAVAGSNSVLVSFPNGETRQLAPGPSSTIAKSVIEVFAPRFLEIPGVVWLSESRRKVVARDDDLARRIGLVIQSERNLPDIILVDLGPAEPILVFVEVVATDGPINESRKNALLKIVGQAGYSQQQIAFLTAYRDKDEGAFRKTISSLAWGSFAWFASEPMNIMALHEGTENENRTLSDLIQVP